MRYALLASAALFVSGCAVMQPPEAVETLETAIPETTDIPEVFSEAEAAADVIEGDVQNGWLATFEDPQLEAIVAEAIENNLSLRAAVARLDAAAGLATQASSELQPTIALGGSGSGREGFSSTDPSLTSSGASLNMSWEVDIWGRVRSQAAAGEAGFRATEAQLHWAYNSVAAQTAKTWYLLTEARLQEELAREAVALYARTQQLVEAKYAQGQVTQGDVALVRAQVASAQSARRQATSGRLAASRAIELLLGRYPSAELEGSSDLVARPPAIPIGLPSELLTRRPDLIAAQQAVAVEFFQVQQAEAARLPQVTLTAGVGTTSNELSDIISLGSDFWSVGANFLAPIYTGGALEAQVQIENAEQEIALANYGLAALNAFGEVEQSLANETLLGERKNLQDIVVEETAEALRVAEIQFDVGRVDLLSVLQQQGQLIGARASQINMHNQLLQQRIDLHLALGGDFDDAEDADAAEATEPADAQSP